MRATWLQRLAFAVALIASLAVWSSDGAWAGYGARASEVRSQLSDQKLDREEKEAIEKALDRYFRLRDQCLEALLDILKEDDEDAEQAEEWPKQVGECRTQSSNILGDAFDSMDQGEVSAAARDFRNAVEIVEIHFFSGLMGVNAASSRDRIAVIGARVDKLIDDLDAKWKKFESRDNSIDKGTKQVAEEVKKIFNEAIASAAQRHKNAKEQLADIVTELGKYSWPDTPSHVVNEVKKLLPLLKVYADYWTPKSGEVSSRIERYKGLVRSETGLLITFRKVRDEVKEFLDDNDFPMAKSAYEQARKSLDDWKGKVSTSGQKSDAGAFASDALDALSSHLDRTEDHYNEFVKKNEEKFFGPVGPAITEELLEKRSWESRGREILGMNLDAKLREWNNQAQGFFEVSMSGLSSEQRSWLKDQLRRDLDNLARALERAEKKLGRERMESWLDRTSLESELD